MHKKPLFAFYGDDFTGSTDALEWLCRAGLKTVLFLEPPTPEQLAAHKDVQAFGVAGATRSLHPSAMEEALIPAFERLKETGAAYVHYKVCSTFDSSPLIGSIGKAIEMGAAVFENDFTPVIQSAPVLGRYLFFGNLFARMGIGSNGDVFRLDRHPSMKHHPTTPADESDLRLHLAKQTTKKLGLVPILDVVAGEEKMEYTIEKNRADGVAVLFFDALENEHLAKIAAVLEKQTTKPLFLVGSSGVEIAFGQFFQTKLQLSEPLWPAPEEATPLLVVCGSCSPVTTAQLAWAWRNGFDEVALHVPAILSGDAVQEVENVLQKALPILQAKRSLIVHSAAEKRVATAEKTAQKLGTALGDVARQLIQKTGIKRLVVAGGDTSSYAARALGIESVEMIAPLAPGAPLCCARAKEKHVNGLQVCFKGGQVGCEDFFGMARSAQPAGV